MGDASFLDFAFQWNETPRYVWLVEITSQAGLLSASLTVQICNSEA